MVKQPRGTQRYGPTQRDDEDTLTQAIVTLTGQDVISNVYPHRVGPDDV